MITVIYPGTFDPITNGHLDIIQRTARLFPQVLVAVASNPNKRPLFDLDTRVTLVKQTVAHLPNVSVVGFLDLLADVVKARQITAIIRGVRSASDFDYELQLAHLNRVLTEGVESLFFPPSERWSYVSSTMIREIHLHHGDVRKLVPEVVYQALEALKNKTP